jgi:hypothetical protein
MKKFLTIVALVAFVAAAPLAIAAGDKVNCCVKGRAGEEDQGKVIESCQKVSKAECAKAKGRVVKDCKECKK